ncbi:hypothetical protein ACW9YQ_17780 (plasmid) [Paraburkholderia strydomiana]
MLRKAKSVWNQLRESGKQHAEAFTAIAVRPLLAWRSLISTVRQLFKLPFSLNTVVRKEMCSWKSLNTHHKRFPMSLWARLLMLAGEHPALLSVGLPCLFWLTYELAHLLPIALMPHGYIGWGQSEQLSYFATLWSVQATLAALAYPIVIAFVAVFLQRRPAADSFMQLYMLNSGALAAGLSSLLLVVVMGIQYFLMVYRGAPSLLGYGVVDTVWFVANAILTAHFLFRTVEFLRPEVQVDIVRRYVARVAFPREVSRLYAFQVFAQGRRLGWTPLPEYADQSADDGPKVLLSHYFFEDGEAQGAVRLRSESRLVNVRLWPLWFVLRAWSDAAHRLPPPKKASNEYLVKWPLLSIPLTPGALYTDTFDLARVTAGPELSPAHRQILRHAFVFRPVARERYEIRVQTVIEEFALDARTAALNADDKVFTRAWSALIDVHELLLGLSAFVDDNGRHSSWALMPDGDTFFQRSMHENWHNGYDSVFVAAIDSIPRNSSLIRRACHLVTHLNRDVLARMPTEVNVGLLQLLGLLMYRLGSWWTQRIEEQGASDCGAHRAVSLNPPLRGHFEHVVSTFVAGWENAKKHLADIPEARSNFVWTDSHAIARLHSEHVQGTARLLLSAVARGDRTTAEWLADSLIKWWDDLHYENVHYTLYDKTSFVTIEDLKREWNDLAAHIGLTIDESAPQSDLVMEQQRGVLLAALRNLWSDIQLVTIQLLISWMYERRFLSFTDSLAREIAVALLTSHAYRPGGTASETLSSFAPQDFFVAIIRPYASASSFRSGYAELLSHFVARVKDEGQSNMISSRTYSSTGADGLDTLLTAQLTLLAIQSVSEWAVPPAFERQFDIWVEHDFASVNRLLEYLRTSLVNLRAGQEFSTEVADALLESPKRDLTSAAAVEHLTRSLEKVQQRIESAKTDALVNGPIDPDRLLSISRFASSKAFSQADGPFPFNLFGIIEPVPEQLDDFTLTMSQVRKGELTVAEIDQRAINDGDFWARAMREHVGARVFGDVLRLLRLRDHVTTDAETYWETLKIEAGKIAQAGLQPILLLANQARPDWVWHWQHSDFIQKYQKPSDLRVWKKFEDRQNYVCNFNEIEIYSGRLAAGQSIVVAKEAFKRLRFQQLENGLFVETTWKARSDSQILVDVLLKFSRRVDTEQPDAARLLYTADAASE